MYYDGEEQHMISDESVKERLWTRGLSANVTEIEKCLVRQSSEGYFGPGKLLALALLA